MSSVGYVNKTNSTFHSIRQDTVSALF